MATNLFSFPNMTAGPDVFLVDLATQIPIMPIMSLVFVYIVVFVGGSFTQMRRTGYIDAPIWSTLAFLIIDLMALIYSTKAGIISPITLVVCMALTFFSGLWLFMTRGRFDQ